MMKQLMIIGILLMMTSGAIAGIKNSKHDLSASSTANIKANTEQEICVFCHTPHNSSPQAPLWNRASSGQNYQPYNSTSALASVGQPTGASMLCLSCHDGTIALGDVLSKAGRIQVNQTFIQGNTRIGTDLTDDHPISFNFTSTLAQQRGELINPSSLTGVVKLDSNGQMQCTSCHDPHKNDNGKFLVMQNVESSLCKTCHQKDFWDQTAHSSSGKIKSQACGNCHLPHNAGADERLLDSNFEENNCLSCHNGVIANHDIDAQFSKISRHPIYDFASHDPGAHKPGENIVSTNRHVECVDCHNPHAANANNPLNGVPGVLQNGSTVNSISQTQELCYRCHADSTSISATRTTRQFNRTNTRVEFATGNASYHPVAGTGKNSFVPSLIAPLNTNSRISCVDCHNNDDLGAPLGPHGSNYEPILERQYLTADPTTESSAAYAMCYKCHSRNSILNNQSFPRHSFHINGGGMGGGGMGGGGMGGMGLSTPCNVCHDPHGSQQPKLINFDLNVVSPSNSGRLEHYSNATGAGSGGCYLNCHGRNHDPCTYNSQTGMAGGCMMGGGGGGGGGGHGGM